LAAGVTYVLTYLHDAAERRTMMLPTWRGFDGERVLGFRPLRDLSSAMAGLCGGETRAPR
jgi:hypothetical protein